MSKYHQYSNKVRQKRWTKRLFSRTHYSAVAALSASINIVSPRVTYTSTKLLLSLDGGLVSYSSSGMAICRKMWWRSGRGFLKCQANLFNLGNELFGELHQFFFVPLSIWQLAFNTPTTNSEHEDHVEGYSGGTNLPGVFGYCPQ